MTDAVTIAQHIEAAELARSRRDAKAMIEIGGRLERLGLHGLAWELLADAPLIRKPSQLPEWDGLYSPNKTLLVHRRLRHTGAELRMARFVARCCHHVGRVILWVEPRLVSLFRRSFPELEVVKRVDTKSLPPRCDCAASYERVAQFVAPDAATIREQFIALQPDLTLTEQVSRSLKPRDKPLVGIAWFSTNERKQLPQLDDWVAVLKEQDFTYFSLQYEETKASIENLEQLSGRMIARSCVDQMADIDGFASQVNATDAVLTISNTTAHMAGALGKPCVVILDDLDHLIWPTEGAETPFYPSIRLVRRSGRPWSAVLEEAATQLNAMLGHP